MSLTAFESIPVDFEEDLQRTCVFINHGQLLFHSGIIRATYQNYQIAEHRPVP